MGVCFFFFNKKKNIIKPKVSRIECGNFDFISDTMVRRSLEIDYHALQHKQNLIEQIDMVNDITWTTPPKTQEWEELNSNLFQLHTNESYNRNLKYIEFINKYGWDCFVNNYPLNFNN